MVVEAARRMALVALLPLVRATADEWRHARGSTRQMGSPGFAALRPARDHLVITEHRVVHGGLGRLSDA